MTTTGFTSGSDEHLSEFLFLLAFVATVGVALLFTPLWQIGAGLLAGVAFGARSYWLGLRRER